MYLQNNQNRACAATEDPGHVQGQAGFKTTSPDSGLEQRLNPHLNSGADPTPDPLPAGPPPSWGSHNHGCTLTSYVVRGALTVSTMA